MIDGFKKFFLAKLVGENGNAIIKISSDAKKIKNILKRIK